MNADSAQCFQGKGTSLWLAPEDEQVLGCTANGGSAEATRVSEGDIGQHMNAEEWRNLFGLDGIMAGGLCFSGNVQGNLFSRYGDGRNGCGHLFFSGKGQKWGMGEFVSWCNGWV